MQKTPALFRNWTEQKIDCEFTKESNSIEVWQFWRYYDWVNIGNEIGKDGKFKRVWLVLHNGLGNWLVMIAPLTTKNHLRMQKYYIPIMWREKYNLKDARIILNQIKSIDTKRFASKTSEEKVSLWFVKKILFNYVDLVLGLKKRPTQITWMR